ncbi:MAG: hypothetical protein QG580_145 [Patescibacteria group bacterium]|jgi:hypothetical protein|nr:hypothetical protein [Patescibacteria group bacterium]
MVWDLLKWFLILFFGLFIVWVLSGGPERGGGTKPLIQGPTTINNPVFTEVDFRN